MKKLEFNELTEEEKNWTLDFYKACIKGESFEVKPPTKRAAERVIKDFGEIMEKWNLRKNGV